MAGQRDVDPVAIQAAMTNMENSAEVLKTKVTTAVSAEQGLSGSFYGSAATAFSNAVTVWQEQCRNLLNDMKSFVETTGRAHINYVNTHSQVTTSASTLGGNIPVVTGLPLG